MTRGDYSKYYIQGSDHYLIPKDIFDELFTEMKNWKEEALHHREVIDKAINYIMNTDCVTWDNSSHEDLLNILKEVE